MEGMVQIPAHDSPSRSSLMCPLLQSDWDSTGQANPMTSDVSGASSRCSHDAGNTFHPGMEISSVYYLQHQGSWPCLTYS